MKERMPESGVMVEKRRKEGKEGKVCQNRGVWWRKEEKEGKEGRNARIRG